MDNMNEKSAGPTGNGSQLAPEPILKYFNYSHLPQHLQVVSKPFCILAHSICGDPIVGEKGVCDVLPRGPERTVALRKLLEAKDAAVRTLI